MPGEQRYKSKSVGKQRKVTPIRLESLNTPGASGVYNLKEELGRSVLYRRQRKFGDQRLMTEVSTTKNKVFIVCKDLET